MRETRPLRVMWRGLETELWRFCGATAPVPDPTSKARLSVTKGLDEQSARLAVEFGVGVTEFSISEIAVVRIDGLGDGSRSDGHRTARAQQRRCHETHTKKNH